VPQQLRLFEAPEPPRSPGEVWVARGARAAEALLFSRLDALFTEARKNPALLARPVRILVPSRSLRAHLGAALVRRRGRSIAGVTIQTLHALACEILERAGEPVPRGTPLFDVLAQRLARLEPALRKGLNDLVDGYGAVAGTVRDLLDAGLEHDLAEAIDEALATDGPRVASRAEVDRARALVRVAARTEALAPALGLGRASNLLRRAGELFAADPDGVLPFRALLIHGFSDATGVGTDFLQELLRNGARLILDHPPAPGSVMGGLERAFTERFTERISMVARFVPAPPPRSTDPPAPEIESVEAVGAEAEAREVARRVRALLDGGARPEAIGVVARDLAPYALLLRRHFRRLGVPFSGLAARGALEPAGRRARAFLELLRRGEEVPADRWLDTVAALALPGRNGRRSMAGLLVDLRLAFYALGAGRLRDVAELAPDTFLKKNETGEWYALPIRQGLRAAAGEEGQEVEEGETYAARRRVDGLLLRAAVRTAARVRDRLAGWPEEAPAAEHFRRLRALLVTDLGWELEAADTGAVLAALGELEREVPGDFPLTREELRPLVVRACAEVGVAPLGGDGGGVQVLNVTEARGRTFDHLFVAGLNRDVFPRGIREDPLLPDDLRQVLRRVLPDIPIKRAGFDEERYLFAWLLSASPSITLSWQRADDDGKPRSPSPLLRGPREPRKAPSLWTPSAERLRPADEHAVIAATQAPRLSFGRVLAVALGEARSELLGEEPEIRLDPAVLAAVRVAVLDEMDPDLRLPEGRAVRQRLGPYFGFVGPPELRRMDLHVTHLETMAGCPWQLFLGRVLQLEPTPDPLAALPGADPLLLGNVVHAVLERIVREGGAGTGDPAAVVWPSPERFELILVEEARRLLTLEGILLPGLAHALAERARPLLAVAREMDWPQGAAVPVLHAERAEEVEVRDVEGRPRRLRFRADRIDQVADGLRFTDYKTGKPLSEARRPEYRRRKFLERLRQGTLLQSTAYLLAAQGEPAEGRYLYLKPGLDDPEARVHAVTTDDREAAEAFANAVSATLAAWDAGTFFPRVVDPAGNKEPARCGFCAVAEACIRGDSGARLRLFEWASRSGREDSALLRVWRLAAKEERGEQENGNDHGTPVEEVP
jgi:RecB family exonuclease/superfamily I DNA/RNA helicase